MPVGIIFKNPPLGQEPDTIEGKFELDELSRSKLTEFHMWDHELDSSLVEKLASCQSFEQGNVHRWEDIKIHKVAVHELKDRADLCVTKRKIAIYPKKIKRKLLDQFCKLQGGVGFIPQSEEENNEIVRKLNLMSDDCMDANYAMGSLWVGAVFRYPKIYFVHANGTKAEANFSKMILTKSMSKKFDCIFLLGDGTWDHSLNCEFLSICASCAFDGVPVLSLRGLAPDSKLDTVFYTEVGPDGKVYYDGYRGSEMRLSEDGEWTISGTADDEQHPFFMTLKEKEVCKALLFLKLESLE